MDSVTSKNEKSLLCVQELVPVTVSLAFDLHDQASMVTGSFGL